MAHSMDLLGNLPAEVWQQIVSRIDIRRLYSKATVSKSYYATLDVSIVNLGLYHSRLLLDHEFDLKRLVNLERLHVHHTLLSHSGVQSVLGHLKELIVSEGYVNPLHAPIGPFVSINSATRLTRLELDPSCSIFVCDLIVRIATQLRHLRIENNMTDTYFKQLTNLQTLTTRNNTNFTDNSIVHLTRLEHIDFYTSCSRITFGALSKLPFLTSLTLRDSTTDNLCALKDSLTLRALKLVNYRRITDEQLRCLTRLETLCISGATELTGTCFTQLAYLSKLSLLKCVHNDHDTLVQSIMSMTRLRSLMCVDTPLRIEHDYDDNHHVYMNNLTTLRSLKITKSSLITHSFLKAMTQLKKLDISLPRNTYLPVFIAKLPVSLEELTLEFSSSVVGELDLIDLSRLRTLQLCKLSGSSSIDETISEAIMTRHTSLRSLTKLNMNFKLGSSELDSLNKYLPAIDVFTLSQPQIHELPKIFTFGASERAKHRSINK